MDVKEAKVTSFDSESLMTHLVLMLMLSNALGIDNRPELHLAVLKVPYMVLGI